MVGSAVRYICLVAIFLTLPLTASAQQRRSAERGSDQNRSEQRQSSERRSDDRRSDGRRSDERKSSAHPPASASPLPWWERQRTPWWERQQTPAWELNRIPGYAQGNVARGMLDQQRYKTQPAPGYAHQRRSRYYPPSVVYVLPPYRYFAESYPTTTQFVVTPPPPTSVTEPQPPVLPMGALRLEVEPKESLQVFVDGVYIGTPTDLGDEIELAPGTRRIELRAHGYRTLAFSAEIVDGRSITYRGSLDSAAVAPVAPTVPVAPPPPAIPGSRTMYMIPGCYLGNVAPTNVTLPAGCDLSKLTTISP
jgi:hypothetical protein